MTGHRFNGKNVLLISPEGWNHLFVSKHHYAIELSKHNRVFFLNPPSQNFSIVKSVYNNLWILDYTPFVKGLRFLPKFIQIFLMRKKMNRIEDFASTRFDCVWSFDNSVFFDFSFLPKHVLKICHIVDYSQNFQFNKAASTADICFGVSQNIVDRLLVFNKNSFLIPHGVASGRSESTDVELPGSNPIKAMYAGNLDSKYLDQELLYQLIENFPHVDFILLGSGGAGWARRQNTYFMGVIKHEFLEGYLKKADILLLIYDVAKYPTQLTNAHKILEYLVSGNVIVSTFISDYSDKQVLLEMSAAKNDIPKIFAKVVSNISVFNSEEKKATRRSYAEKNTYAVRLLEVEQQVERVIFKHVVTNVEQRE